MPTTQQYSLPPILPTQTRGLPAASTFQVPPSNFQDLARLFGKFPASPLFNRGGAPFGAAGPTSSAGGAVSGGNGGGGGDYGGPDAPSAPSPDAPATGLFGSPGAFTGWGSTKDAAIGAAKGGALGLSVAGVPGLVAGALIGGLYGGFKDSFGGPGAGWGSTPGRGASGFGAGEEASSGLEGTDPGVSPGDPGETSGYSGEGGSLGEGEGTSSGYMAAGGILHATRRPEKVVFGEGEPETAVFVPDSMTRPGPHPRRMEVIRQMETLLQQLRAVGGG